MRDNPGRFSAPSFKPIVTSPAGLPLFSTRALVAKVVETDTTETSEGTTFDSSRIFSKAAARQTLRSSWVVGVLIWASTDRCSLQ